MRIDLVFPVLPPVLDGIGDHTARLAEALAGRGHNVRILTAQDSYDDIPGVSVKIAFPLPPRRGIHELVDAIQTDPPDWLFVQFNQFSYGRWGLNPFLPLALYQIQRSGTGVRTAVMFHEDFVPVTSWQNAIMTTWQRVQFWALGQLADQVFFSIEPWVQRYQNWFPGTPVDHLPVGSNMPYVETDRNVIREQLDLSPSTFVMGVFGSLHASRLLSHIRAAAEAVRNKTRDMLLLYIGPDGPDFQKIMREFPVLDAGRLPAEDVSRHLQAMDVYLAPFSDGASTRRGSLLAGLQHGIPTVSTHGPLTDALLVQQDGRAFQLASVDTPTDFARVVVDLYTRPEHSAAMGTEARRFFKAQFSWNQIAQQATDSLTQFDRRVSADTMAPTGPNCAS